MQPTRIELFVNLKAAKALDLTVPLLLLARSNPHLLRTRLVAHAHGRFWL
jgi:hypothetical protein